MKNEKLGSFGTWQVDETGTMSHTGVANLECGQDILDSRLVEYVIPADRVMEEDWEQHMASKKWVVFTDFCEAIDFARFIVKCHESRNFPNTI